MHTPQQQLSGHGGRALREAKPHLQATAAAAAAAANHSNSCVAQQQPHLSTPIVRAVSAKKRASKRSTELTTRSAATTAASRMASASVPLALNADMSSYPGARVCNRACGLTHAEAASSNQG
eukprot:scaffold120209_cov19-Tisochrysis_lutea.AAC.1